MPVIRVVIVAILFAGVTYLGIRIAADKYRRAEEIMTGKRKSRHRATKPSEKPGTDRRER